MKGLPIVAAILTGLQVGAALVASSYVIDQTTPATLAALRYFVAFLFLFPVMLLFSRRAFDVIDIVPISALGVVQFGFLVALLNYAVQFLPAAQVALIFSTFPLQTLILSVLLGRETLTLLKAIGVLLTILGVGVSVIDKLTLNIPQETEYFAILAAFLAAFSGALCSVLYAPFLRKYPAQNVSVLAMFASVLVLGGYAVLVDGLPSITGINTMGWWVILFIGFSSAAGYFLWLWALKYLSPTRVTIFLSLGPISSAVFGYLLLSEAITFYLFGGILFVIAGLICGFYQRQSVS
ncbi:DMT family transporter [Sneathiella sp.]|jgi:drug/metabolite transporter (DMT)-like permease|uniref:DMT family transporter n=1 Tax=Sneathiella sp. TaxID=1964365 RepID=UPI0039E27AFD